MSRSNRHSLAIGLTSVLVLATGCAPAWAQETDHAAHHPAAKPSCVTIVAKARGSAHAAIYRLHRTRVPTITGR